MLSYTKAIEKFGITHTARQERKWKNKTGLAYKLASKFANKEGEEITAEAIELAKLDMSKPGPNKNKKVKEQGRNRTSRKETRNGNRREEAQRQKTHKKNKWRRRKELAEQS